MRVTKRICLGLLALLVVAMATGTPASAQQQQKPNILFIMGDDIGWMQPMMPLRLPRLFNLRSDPFERAQQEAGDYVRWFVDHAFVLVPAQSLVGQFLTSFQQFPPRQRPGSFTVEQAMEKLRNPPSSN